MQRTLRAEKLFTGTEWLYNQEIVIEEGLIQSIAPATDHPFVNGKVS
jgi:N-acetylglucosamine-6-phosphate deacetylase